MYVLARKGIGGGRHKAMKGGRQEPRQEGGRVRKGRGGRDEVLVEAVSAGKVTDIVLAGV